MGDSGLPSSDKGRQATRALVGGLAGANGWCSARRPAKSVAVMLAGLRASDCDRMLEASGLLCQASAGRIVTGWLAAMADGVADVLACAGLL
jgi:hypothetical protein